MLYSSRDMSPEPRRNHVRKYLLAILLSLPGWFASAAAVAQPLRTVAVIDAVKFPAKAKQAHERLRATLEESMAAKNWYLVQMRPIADCGSTTECLGKVATDNGTKYVLRLSGNRTQDDGYDITLELYQVATAHIQRSGAYCDYCDLPRINEVTSHSVMAMLSNALKEEADLKAAKQAALAPAPLPLPAVAPSPTAPPNITTPPVVPAAKSMSWVPWVFVGVGAVVLGYGASAIHENGKSTGTCSPMHVPATCDHYSSQTLGIATAVGGALVAATGFVWLALTPSRSTTVSLSPSHVTLNLRF